MMILVLYWNSLLPWDHRPASLQQPHYIQPTCNLLHTRTLHYIYIYTFLAKTRLTHPPASHLAAFYAAFHCIINWGKVQSVKYRNV
jgi:hypothetical protein